MANVSLKGRVGAYNELFDEIRNNVGDDSLALAILHNVAKDLRMEQIRSERSTSQDTQAPPRQKGFLRSLGVEFDEKLSKNAASELIESTLANEAR